VIEYADKPVVIWFTKGPRSGPEYGLARADRRFGAAVCCFIVACGPNTDRLRADVLATGVNRHESHGKAAVAVLLIKPVMPR
jgi:hypothetical protein